MTQRKAKSITCPVEGILSIISGKWKVMVLYFLMQGTKRFNELHRALPGISHRTLVKQLRELEQDGILRRKIYPQIPPKVEYSLTEKGKSMEPILNAMHKWSERYGRT